MLQTRTDRQPLTIAILTKNEEALIARAIDSAAFADEVLVLDSGSTDQTREIAARHGARVVEQPWLGWLGQHNKAVEVAAHDWVMKLDADEIVSEPLRAAIETALAGNPDPRDGFVVERIDEFMGELLPATRRRSKADTFVRLFNRTKSGWDPEVMIHEEVKVGGLRHKLEGPLLHWRNASLNRMVTIYNANSEVEAKALLRRYPNGPSAVQIVCKPILRFMWSYVRSSGWRHGMRGYHRAVVQAFADYLALSKAWETVHAPPQVHPRADQMNAGAARSG